MSQNPNAHDWTCVTCGETLEQEEAPSGWAIVIVFPNTETLHCADCWRPRTQADAPSVTHSPMAWVIDREALADDCSPQHAALIVHRVNTWEGLRDALRRIGSIPGRDNGCENFTGETTCRDPRSGRIIDSPYTADGWCDACIANDALETAEANQ